MIYDVGGCCRDVEFFRTRASASSGVPRPSESFRGGRVIKPDRVSYVKRFGVVLFRVRPRTDGPGDGVVIAREARSGITVSSSIGNERDEPVVSGERLFGSLASVDSEGVAESKGIMGVEGG